MSETSLILENRRTDILLDEQLDFIRSIYSNRYANSINYVIPALRVINSSTGPEREAFLEMTVSEVLIDIYTQIIEHPLSEITARYEYNLGWQKDDQWKLKMGERTLDDVYEEAISTSNGQIPEFEIKRNEKNYSNYNKLRKARQKGERRTFVEFSPSPKMTSEAKKRGYFGNDTIFFFSFEDREEKVIQKWLPASSSDEYTSLFSSLGINLEETDDLSIMSQSGFFDSENLDKVISFIADKTKKLEETKTQIIESHANSFIWENVKEEFKEMIINAANKLSNKADISDDLSELSETMAVMQYGFRKFIHDVMSGEINMNYANNGNFTEFQSMDRSSQKKEMKDVGYTMTGCGVQEEFSNFGKVSSMVNVSFGGDIQPTPGRPDPVKCDLCGKVIKYVKNGDPSTYDPNLIHCGKKYGC